MSARPAPLRATREAAPADVAADVAVGQEWSIDAAGLDPGRLAGEAGKEALAGFFDALVTELDLHPVAAPVWHVFPGPHEGVTGIVALSESHLACHTFPESGGLTLNLYTCRARPAPDWAGIVRAHLAPSAAPDGVRLTARVLERTLPGGGAER